MTDIDNTIKAIEAFPRIPSEIGVGPGRIIIDRSDGSFRTHLNQAQLAALCTRYRELEAAVKHYADEATWVCAECRNRKDDACPKVRYEFDPNHPRKHGYDLARAALEGREG
jgi:hypothetical protein